MTMNEHKGNIYKGIVVVVPTRNRSELAINAINSVLKLSPTSSVFVLVSDNSTSPEEIKKLSAFCRGITHKRLRYIRPAEPLPMTEHWDWAIHQALHMYDVNHFIYLTDRMRFNSKALEKLMCIVETYPDKVVSYNHDRINDLAKPIRLEQNFWTGSLFEVASSHLLYLSSQVTWHGSLPRMLNCIVPRSLLNYLCHRFGNVFSSIAPDFNFCYRCLDAVNSILYYDDAPIVHYALDRSNGHSTSRGEKTEDAADFVANLGHKKLNSATPIPEIMTVGNAIVHEYCIVKEETQSTVFPDLDIDKYLQCLSWEVAQMSNSSLRGKMREILKARGNVISSKGLSTTWGQPRPRNFFLFKFRKLGDINIVWGKLVRLSKRSCIRLSRSSCTRQMWMVLYKIFGIRPPVDQKFRFSSLDEAIDYWEKFPSRKSSIPSHIDVLLALPTTKSKGD